MYSKIKPHNGAITLSFITTVLNRQIGAFRKYSGSFSLFLSSLSQPYSKTNLFISSSFYKKYSIRFSHEFCTEVSGLRKYSAPLLWHWSVHHPWDALTTWIKVLILSGSLSWSGSGWSGLGLWIWPCNHLATKSYRQKTLLNLHLEDTRCCSPHTRFFSCAETWWWQHRVFQQQGLRDPC